VQRAERRTGGKRLLGLPRTLPGLVERGEDERVEAGIACVDPGDDRVEKFDRGEVATPDAGGQLGGGGVGELIRHGHR
jgi:hypothetical protein